MDEFESFLTVPKMKQTTTLMSHMKKLCVMTEYIQRNMQ